MSQVQHIALAPERQALRDANQLRAVNAQEEGTGVRHLPGGVYGFTGAPATNEIPLFGKPVFECFEVQKRADGGLVFVGYVTEKEKQVIEQGLDPVVADLYPEPHGESSALVAIPGVRVDRRRPPTRENGNSMKVDIGPR
ncbi:hypothetical protein [uncultured Paludibaculum sp.]|uniref:hypothetical protein n=1 Tax=uncultured Paludibaculum sp. TaxID=1765020 RepID=UPI002AAB42A0|nr:hypothetical protein [uncultured Paludibaculum sp.]